MPEREFSRSRHCVPTRRGWGIFVFLFCCWHFHGNALVAEERRLNQIQSIGSHSSYHIAAPSEILGLIRLAMPDAAEALDYSRDPIVDQLGSQRLRQLELDLYADPEGGLYANPFGHASLPQNDETAKSHPNANGVMDTPGPSTGKDVVIGNK